MKIHVGCCGWPVARGKYFKKFQAVEIQSTFYKLPMIKTAIRWKEESPNGFSYTMKAWQALTHPTSSPTWRRARVKLTEPQKRNYGMLRPTRENLEAWERTKKVAEALGARECVVQCPARFKCTPKNAKNMRKFFGKIDRGRLAIAWEPRGDWKQRPGEVKKLCDELDLIHVVDLMRYDPVSRHPIAYIRLHGLNPREYDYRYDYSKDELEELAKRLRALAKKHREVYCMFNNYEMFSNAQQLMEIL
ncbi:MAG: DUF72 domain-containing protein [Candidatus Hadarchaeota archaeon]|nr:DUF72 domain-containing protein [Candidatus Hadarchaeota archaeon]